jgi:hypothetical protein
MCATDIVFYSQLEDFLKGVDGVLAANGVALVAADVVVGGEEDADCVIWGCDT